MAVSCTYCQDEINSLRVQCCVCPEIELCLQCFTSGAEIGTHKNDHSYKFVDHCAVKIFGGRGSWTGREELKLLDGMEYYGYGNWEFVSRHIETRTADEVKDEYTRRFMDGNLGRITWAEVANNRPNVQEHFVEDLGPLSPAVTSKLPPLDVTPEESKLLGYMPHRDDYEREYDMESERLVSSLQLNTSKDSDIEVALKLAQVDIYVRKLRERARRKRVVRDYQLVAKFFENARKDNLKKPTTPEQKEFRDKMRVFCQFLTSGEHERLIQSIEKEQELRFRLSELLKYRSLGITTQKEAIHYEQHAEFERQQQPGSSGYETPVPANQLKNGKNEENQSFTDEKFTWLREDGYEKYNYSSNFDDNKLSSASEIELPSLPSESLLSLNEFQLCSSLNLNPTRYLILKAFIILDHLFQGKFRLSDFEICTEPGVKEAVSQYLNDCGWLPKFKAK